MLRLPQREGLIRARMAGVRATTAPTITFLDSHVECADGWLPPLLERVGANSTTVISPVIDVIDALTFRRAPTPAHGDGGGGGGGGDDGDEHWQGLTRRFPGPRRLRLGPHIRLARQRTREGRDA